mmetsp:Transcript_29662/g.81641  ORF Transcript_29662/g.81641 Transcript_29662/m.81641 type:complete len:202 (-) Transcript_29662:439-1044(-)
MTSQSVSSSEFFLSSGLSVMAARMRRYSSTVKAHPMTAEAAKPMMRMLSAASKGGFRESSGMKSPIFSLKSFKETQAAAKIAVRPTPKGRNALRCSAVARIFSCSHASATACPELCRAKPRDLVPELSPAEVWTKRPLVTAGRNAAKKGRVAVALATTASTTAVVPAMSIFGEASGVDMRRFSWSRAMLSMAERNFRSSPV